MAIRYIWFPQKPYGPTSIRYKWEMAKRIEMRREITGNATSKEIKTARMSIDESVAKLWPGLVYRDYRVENYGKLNAIIFTYQEPGPVRKWISDARKRLRAAWIVLRHLSTP
jgi:hypothetical protein